MTLSTFIIYVSDRLLYYIIFLLPANFIHHLQFRIIVSTGMHRSCNYFITLNFSIILVIIVCTKTLFLSLFFFKVNHQISHIHHSIHFYNAFILQWLDTCILINLQHYKIYNYNHNCSTNKHATMVIFFEPWQKGFI